MIRTEPLKGTTAGQGHAVLFEPANAALASFFIEGPFCPAALKGTKSIFGSIRSTSIDGATVSFTHAETTSQGTLRFGSKEGPKLGINGTFTFSAKATTDTGYTPISPTTTGEGP